MALDQPLSLNQLLALLESSAVDAWVEDSNSGSLLDLILAVSDCLGDAAASPMISCDLLVPVPELSEVDNPSS